MKSRHSPLSTLRSPLLVLALLLAGCPRSDSVNEPSPSKRPLDGVKLRLAVVNDPALATAIGRLRGEWNAQTGSSLEVIETAENDIARRDSLPADAVVCPSHLLGTLAERKLLAPVPPDVVRSSQWAGLFELLKVREAAWGRETLAVPFGSPVFCCYYRADLLEKLGRRPPQTWADYQDLSALLARRKPSGVKAWCGTIEPLVPGWAGLTLLARATPAMKHRDNYSALFNIETMEPLIAGPPVVDALEQLVATVKAGPAEPLAYDPAAARAAFWRGECAMALTWPTAARGERGEGRGERADGKAASKTQGLAASAASSPADKSQKPEPKLPATLPAKVDPKIRVGFAELPGSRRVYSLSSRGWETRSEDDDPRVPLLDISGRLGVVSAKSAHTEAAFQLLLWLSDDRNSPQVSAASPATTLFRQSNMRSPMAWVEKPVGPTAAVKYADATEAAFRHEQWVGALRMPGRTEYLAALDEAVASAVRGEKSPLEALLDADAKWRKITDRLGLERQKAAYRHSLGLE
ncbi:MAG: extracellular solute-binding protein [Thermoguttaceae bacterium]